MNALKEATTIHLTLDSRYVPTWGMKEGLRELIQNWLDAGGVGRPEHADGRVALENPGASMGREVLLIGHSTKPGTDARGQFGEGLKLGALALLRDGCGVSVQTGEETWVAKLDAHPVLGQKVLAWDINQGGEYAGVRVIVDGITGEDWASMRRVFIWESDPSKSSLLQSDDLRGAVYVKGIHVMDNAELAFGYNIHDLKTDRDRKLVDNFQLGHSANRIMLNALSAGEVSGAAVLSAYTKKSLETQYPAYNVKLNAAGRQALDEAWEESFSDVVPCAYYDHDTREKLETLGKKAVCVSDQLLGFLDVADGKSVLKDLKEGRIAHNLTPQEDRHLKWALSIVKAGVPEVPRVEVSKFMDSDIGCVREGATLHINANTLSSKTLALCQIAKGLDANMPAIIDHILKTNGVVQA